MFGAQLAGLALQIIAQQFDLVSRRRRHFRRRRNGSSRRGDQYRSATLKQAIAGLGRLLFRRRQMPGHRAGRLNPVAGQNISRLGKRGRVGHGGAGGDDRRIVAWHIGDQQTHHLRRRGRGRQPTALDGGEMLAHHVHLVNGRAASQQGLIDGLFVGQGQARTWQAQQRRAAARDQNQQQIVGAQFPGHGQDAPGCGLPRRIGHGVGGLNNFDMTGRHAMAVSCNDQAFHGGGPILFNRTRHAGGRLAGAQHQCAARRREGQMRAETDHRIGGGNRRLEQPLQ